MTQQDDITQRVLTAEHHLNELMRLTQPWPNATIPCATVRSHVEQALSKLPAAVADERAAFDDFIYERVCSEQPYSHFDVWQARAALASAPVGDAAPEYAYSDDGRTVTMTNAHRAPSRQASAPVAGEAKSPDRAMLEAVMNDLNVSDWNCERCGHTEECSTMDAALMLRDYLAAPQASEAVRNAALEEAYEAVACLYAAYYQHSKRSESDDILQALKQAGDDIRALKQPQANKDAPVCSCPSGDGSLRPCAVHSAQPTNDGGSNR